MNELIKLFTDFDLHKSAIILTRDDGSIKITVLCHDRENLNENISIEENIGIRDFKKITSDPQQINATFSRYAGALGHKLQRRKNETPA